MARRALGCLRSPDVSETILKLYLRPLRSGRAPCENTNHSLSLSESYICISNNQHISVRGRRLYADRRLTKPVCTFCTLYRARVGACVNRFFCRDQGFANNSLAGFLFFSHCRARQPEQILDIYSIFGADLQTTASFLLLTQTTNLILMADRIEAR